MAEDLNILHWLNCGPHIVLPWLGYGWLGCGLIGSGLRRLGSHQTLTASAGLRLSRGLGSILRNTDSRARGVSEKISLSFIGFIHVF
jgi:hypothetical protein